MGGPRAAGGSACYPTAPLHRRRRHRLKALLVSLPPSPPLLQQLLAMESSAPELAELLKLVCKTFWSATYMAIPPLLNTEPQFAGWMGGFLALIQRPLPLVRAWCLCGGWRADAQSKTSAAGSSGGGAESALSMRAAQRSKLHSRRLLLPQDQLPADPDARKGWQWSKAKKWVMHIAYRLFNR